MSRKDPRRAITVVLPPAVMARLRVRRARSRGRRLMDALRATLADALADPDPVLVPCADAPPGTPARLLQLPAPVRARLGRLCRDRGLPEQAAINALVIGLAPDCARLHRRAGRSRLASAASLPLNAATRRTRPRC